MAVASKPQGAIPGGAAASADLGGSSNYSTEKVERRSLGKGSMSTALEHG